MHLVLYPLSSWRDTNRKTHPNNILTLMQWFLFNDDQVTAVSEAEVLSVDAYLLFYTLHSLSIMA